MRHSVAIGSRLNDSLLEHLLRLPGEEEICFALWFPSRGTKRLTAILHESILPGPKDRNLHGSVSFNAVFLERAIAVAMSARAGLALLHSHIGPGWQGMSEDDYLAEQNISGAVWASTGLPLLGLTLGTDGAWSA